MKNEHRVMTECAAEAARIARGVTADRLAGPTPCQGWDVRALVNHWVLYTSHGLEHRALRKPLPDELTARDFTADADWAERYAAQLDRAVTAWSEPDVWEGEVDLGGAALPAARIAAMVIKEMAVHGWDVARATGQEVRLSEESAAFVLKVVEDNAELYRQYEGFADPVRPAPAATTFERALAASGRDPRGSA
ncbi:TIGR03086 family metal-binding protein [Streptomyces sp. NPDC048111]|uniref:TIGR03086 family metal-binding protein n=1 Tax=Streptomyces sp. NPDC048111 TaxID=3365500 RepID=UPI0037128E11